MSTDLDYSVLIKAVDSLARALDQPKNEFTRDSVIQRFEYTYELCWKFLKRYLEISEGVATVDLLSRKELFRLAAEKGLIDDVVAWFEYHRSRNETSHTYQETKAEEVYECAKRFALDAKKLQSKLTNR